MLSVILPGLFPVLLESVSPTDFVPVFIQTGGLGAIAWILYRFFRNAVAAHEKRADEWNQAYLAERKRSDEKDAQLAHILSAIKAGTSSGSGVS